MHDWQSLSHVRWECKYHVVIIPKYRKRKLYGKFKRHVGEIIKDLCRQRGVELIGRQFEIGPYPHVSERTTEVQHCVRNWFLERQECSANPPVYGKKQTNEGKAFLVSRILREHSRFG